MATRKELLLSLLALDRPMNQVRRELAVFPWESVRPVVTLNRSDVVTILRRFLNGELTASQLTDWANAIEGREDIGRESGQEDTLEIIFALANPVLVGPFTTSEATRWLARLESAAPSPARIVEERR